jgi:hypothetical protein
VRLIRHHAVVERAVRFDVAGTPAGDAGEPVDGRDLVEHVGLELGGPDVHGTTAEAGEVAVRHLCADHDAELDAGGHRVVDGPRVARVEAAGDVGAGQQRQEGGVVAEAPAAERLGDVGVEVDAHLTPVQVRISPCRFCLGPPRPDRAHRMAGYRGVSVCLAVEGLP